MTLTLVSCFYKINNTHGNTLLKHEPEKYIEWITKFLTIVKNFNLVIFMDIFTYDYICQYKLNEIIDSKSDKIKVVFKEKSQFYCYRFKNYFIKNQKYVTFDNYNKMSWEMNLIWCEKINFVSDTIVNKYFDTEYYAWCDIGYFRNDPNGDLTLEELKEWGSNTKVITNPNNINKITYGSPYKHFNSVETWSKIIKNGLYYVLKNKINSTSDPSTPRSVAGNFFILHKNKINWWCQTFYSILYFYFKNNGVLYHDETILSICLALYPDNFNIIVEKNPRFSDTWRLFQRYLL
jgi:hypothetical protein